VTFSAYSLMKSFRLPLTTTNDDFLPGRQRAAPELCADSWPSSCYVRKYRYKCNLGNLVVGVDRYCAGRYRLIVRFAAGAYQIVPSIGKVGAGLAAHPGAQRESPRNGSERV
jgi:hypothetical protein